MHIREEALLSKVRSGDEAARYTALAVLFRCRAVTPVVDVVEALQKAPVDRLLWLRPVLHQVLRETSWPSIREAVSRGDPWALGVCAARRHPEAVEVLIRLLDPGRTDSSQVDAAWVLGRLGDRRAVPALVRQLRHGTCASAAEAAEALGLIGDPEALPALRDAAVQEGNWPQPDAFKALGRLGEWEDLSLMEHLAGNTEGRWNSEAGVALSVLVERLRATVR
jgi:HEAT repeat protein